MTANLTNGPTILITKMDGHRRAPEYRHYQDDADMRELERLGYVENDGREWWRLTDAGRAFVGDLYEHMCQARRANWGDLWRNEFMAGAMQDTD